MIQLTPQMRILLAVEPVDLRQGIDGLAARARQAVSPDPLAGALIVFRSRRRRALKLLVYDGPGFWRFPKRLSQGRFGGWPEATAGPTVRGDPPALPRWLWNGDPTRAAAAPMWRAVPVASWAGDDPIAALARASAPRPLAARDRCIGWPAEGRRRHRHLLADNTRCLILPGVQVPHLASHLLGRVARRISPDGPTLSAHPIPRLETFLDPARFRGICYRAANWICLGLTTGRGHKARPSRHDQPRKALWVYPLAGDFRRRLPPAP